MEFVLILQLRMINAGYPCKHFWTSCSYGTIALIHRIKKTPLRATVPQLGHLGTRHSRHELGQIILHYFL